MIVLDTNVLSALMRPEPAPPVEAWLGSYDPQSVWTSAITLFEVRIGLNLLEPGRRKRALEEKFQLVVERELSGRVLPFDGRAADMAGEISARLTRMGRPIEIRDSQIAGIVSACGATLATRNVRHFKVTGVSVVNPWED